MILYSKKIWNEDRADFLEGFLEIEKSKIKTIKFGKPEGKIAKSKIQDLGSLYLAPSFIDLHVHSRDFEEKHKQSFDELDQQAILGGVRVVACMANTFPRIDSVERVQEFLKFTRKFRTKMIPFAAVTKNLDGKEPTDWKNLLKLPIAGLSDDGKPILDERLFESVCRAAKQSKKIISLHEEDTRISKSSCLHLSESSVRLGVEGSSCESEISMVERDLRIGQKTGAHLHFAHLSSQHSVSLLRKARKQGFQFSAELTPHHALLTVREAEKFSHDRLSLFKVCPVIREEEDRMALLKAAKEGLIDCFATDHAPHSEFEKDQPIQCAAHGMISIEHYFPLYNELRRQAKMSWKAFFRATSARPAELLGLSSIGQLKTGREASFLVFNPEEMSPIQFRASRAQNSPWEGKSFRGRILQHWMMGQKVMDEGRTLT